VSAGLYLPHRLAQVEAEPIDLAPHPAFRSWEEHGEIYGSTEFPYTVRIDQRDAAVLYVGVKHFSDPDDPQVAELRRLWDGFSPTVALNEGRSKYLRWGNAIVPGVNDPKLVYDLAQRDGVEVYSIERRYQDEVEALLETWPPELVAAYFSLRVITGEAGGDAARAESIAPALIAKRTDVDGLRGAITTMADLDEVWARHLPDAPDWRTLPSADSAGLMRRIGDDSREVRGRHMVRAIATLAARGERVFAVVGASHVIRHEPTLRSLLTGSSPEPIPTDQDIEAEPPAAR